MPTYEYVCKKCTAHLDIFHSMKDADLKICPKDKCRKKVWGKGAIVKQMGTGAGFIFKGSGFYITDYRSAGYKKAAKEASGGGEKSGEKSSEKKKAPDSGAGSGTTAGGATKSGEGKFGKSK
jgi:putative FmdB family regulatory protein